MEERKIKWGFWNLCIKTKVTVKSNVRMRLTLKFLVLRNILKHSLSLQLRHSYCVLKTPTSLSLFVNICLNKLFNNRKKIKVTLAFNLALHKYLQKLWNKFYKHNLLHICFKKCDEWEYRYLYRHTKSTNSYIVFVFHWKFILLLGR